MFNKKLIAVLTKILGVFTIFGAVIFSISGFYTANQEATGSAAERAGYLVGYEIGGLAFFAFFYIVLAALYRGNDKK